MYPKNEPVTLETHIMDKLIYTDFMPFVPFVVRIALSIVIAVIRDVETTIFLDLLGKKGCSKGLHEEMVRYNGYMSSWATSYSLHVNSVVHTFE